jgi:hypothetical protein
MPCNPVPGIFDSKRGWLAGWLAGCNNGAISIFIVLKGWVKFIKLLIYYMGAGINVKGKAALGRGSKYRAT